jgi:hypothetical protein
MFASIIISLLLAVLLLDNANADIFGITVEFAANNTETIITTVSVDPISGDFTVIIDNFVYIGGSATYDGISTFDQKKNRLYYTPDYESSFVYSVDVATPSLLPPISINADFVQSIVWDRTNAQLLVTGIYPNQSVAIVAVPDNGPAVELLNLTMYGISAPRAAALDWSIGRYYMIYNSTELSLASFSVNNVINLKTTPFPCGQSIFPIYLAVDVQLNKLIGISLNKKGTYEYFEIFNGKCTTNNLNLIGIITCSSYDPVAHKLYMGYVGSKGTFLYVYSTSTYALTSVPTPSFLADIEVTFQL